MSLLLHAWSALHSLSKRDGVLQAREEPSKPNIDPLPDYHRKGLIAISVMASLSAVATFAMLTFTTYRMLFWRGSAKLYPGHNQYVILIYNLLIADFVQALSFLLNIYWIVHNKIHSPSVVCFLQGLWVQIGDPGSGIFALAIAMHTFMQVNLGRKMEFKWFVVAIVSIWGFIALLAIIPIASHGGDPFAPTGAWCWINQAYEPDRLWTHYVWIFVAEFGTVLLYMVMYFQLRRRLAASVVLGQRHVESLTRLRRVVNYMVIYPFAYLVLSLPLAAGRMATTQGRTPSVTYFCVSGAMITTSGLVDVIMYTLTRKNLILNSQGSADRSLNPFHHYDYRSNHITTVTVDHKREGGLDVGGLIFHGRSNSTDNPRSAHDRDGSTDNIIERDDRHDQHELSDLSKVYQKTTIEITSEPASPSVQTLEQGSPPSSDEREQECEQKLGKPKRAWRR
ncbi:hypothetical protein VTN77DRAFT_1502 [Rasamsonia byssochlamydoides]|uniref:uncharacterized protein n=1 Tax=Rasamsonia byssochlamydoides TaxID=89139 RepID=UPI003742A48F